MANRSNIMGLHGLKNKPSRNSFDLSHRNMFTAKVGELLPCFVQELNPGDSVKVSSSYFTRTAPLQSNAFTRLRENVQFFFVPYCALWKYFDSQVLNMTKNANGGDISRIASSLVDSQKVTTQMPCVNYKTLHAYLLKFINRSAVGSDGGFGNEFISGCYRHAESAKLLQLLGYGNFPEQFANFKVRNDKNNQSGLNFKDIGYRNSPYLSIFRLLAYQKICNDHYMYRQWQPYNASLCNVDYLTPNSSSLLSIDDALLSIPDDTLKADKMNLLDMRFSNLPLDYFSGVLPTSQFGSESVVNLQLGSASGSATISGTTDSDYNNWSSSTPHVPLHKGQNLVVDPDLHAVAIDYGEDVLHTYSHFHSLSGKADISTSLSGEMSIIALRNALAAQKYKEIQLANDVDFQSQVEAHFGIKPNDKDENSLFIGGSSSMININEQINQNLSGDNKATYGAAPQGNGSASIKFTAKTYGVVIGIYRCTPVLDFAHIGIDRTLLKTDASDFVIPELDSIGMQQTFRCEVAAPSPYNDEFHSFKTSDGSTPDMSETYGFAPRYAEYKTSYDRYNGAFCHSLKSWVTGLNFAVAENNALDTWRSINATAMFRCRPDIVKNLFVVSSTNNADDDQLYVGMVNMCYATRNLSRYGLPYSK